MKIEKLMWASTDQLRQEMVSKINEIIDKVNEPVEMNSPLKRTDALDEKKEEIEGNWINSQILKLLLQL